MKRWLFLIVALPLFAGTLSLNAQPGAGPGERLEELQLTDAQRARMKEIREKYRGTFEHMRKDQSQHREAVHKQMEAMREELRSVLDAKQRAAFDAMPKLNRPDGAPAPMQRKTPRGQQPPNQKEREQRPPMPPHAAALHQDIEHYSEQQILPVLKRERKALEAKISPADRQLLASLRTQAKAQPDRPMPLPPNHPLPRADKKKEPAKLEQEDLAKLEKRYEKEIQKILARLEPQVDKWNTDLKAIHDKHSKGAAPAGQPGAPRGPKAYQYLHPKRFLMLAPE